MSNEAIKFLSVDPGETTGWVVVELMNGEVSLVSCGLSLNYSIDEELLKVITSGVHCMVVEKPPTQGNSIPLVQLYGELMGRASDNNLIMNDHSLRTFGPDRWKPWAGRQSIYFPEAMVGDRSLRHCRDAFMMLVWHLVDKYSYDVTKISRHDSKKKTKKANRGLYD